MSIQFFTTGGTIDKSYFDALSEYQVGESQVARILQLGRVMLPYDVTELLRKDSLELDDDDRHLIRKAVIASSSNRIVVAHGTDTMTDTARVLIGIAGKTIVLVGALAPARFSESDAVFNVGMAVAAVQTAPPGVYIAMNGTIFDACRVQKDRKLGAFVAN